MSLLGYFSLLSTRFCLFHPVLKTLTSPWPSSSGTASKPSFAPSLLSTLKLSLIAGCHSGHPGRVNTFLMYTCSHVWSLPVGDRWMLLPASVAPQPQPPLCHLSCPLHFSYLVTPWTWVLCGLVSRGSLAPGTRAQWTSQTSHHLQPALSHLHLTSQSVVHLASFCSWASLNSPLRPHSWLCLTSYEHLCHIVLLAVRWSGTLSKLAWDCLLL